MEFISTADQKEIWSTNKIIEELHYEIISVKGEDGLRKYEEKAKFLLYRIPVWKDPTTGKPPQFIIEIKDITEEVKEQIVDVSYDESYLKDVIKESASILFENLGPKEKA